VGTGVGTSVQELVNIMREFDPDLKIVLEGRREGDPARLIADKSLIEKELQWIPKHSSCKKIIESSIIWYDKISS
jgi:UDP-glucose 4-epimerase